MGIEIVTFQIGTDVVGQPIYHTHLVSGSESKFGTHLEVESKTHY